MFLLTLKISHFNFYNHIGWERKYYLHFICDFTEFRDNVPSQRWQAEEGQERVERLFTELVMLKKLLNLSEVYFPYLKQTDSNTCLASWRLHKKKKRERERESGNHFKNCIICPCQRSLFIRTTGKTMVSHKSRSFSRAWH